MCRRIGCLGCRPDAANRLRTRGGTVSVRRFGTNGSCVLCDRIDTPYVVLRGYRTGLRPRSAVPRPASVHYASPLRSTSS